MTKSYLSLLGSPYILLNEWIPLGVNNVALMAEKLEALESGTCIITDQVDRNPDSATIEMPKSRFRVAVLRYRLTDYLEIRAESIGISPKRMGVHVDASGRISYGVRLESTAGNVDMHSLDSLSIILSDMMMETSDLMKVLLSNYQSRLLDLIYYSESTNREKYALIFASGIEPGITLDDILEDTRYLGEVRQIVDVIDEDRTNVLGDDEFIVTGTSGSLLVSPDPRKYEKVMYYYSLLKGIESTQNNTFGSIWMAWDEINAIKKQLKKSGITAHRREKIAELSGNITLLETVLTYIRKTLQGIEDELPTFIPSLSEEERDLIKLLNTDEILDEIRLRVEDAFFVLEDLEKEVNGLSAIASTLHEGEIRRVFTALRENTAHSVAIGYALEMLEAIIVGVYFIEVMNFMLISSYGDELRLGWEGASLIIASGVLIIYIAWKLIKFMHHRTFEQFKGSH